ncbi:YaaC family protein [Acinetobacter sp. MF4642]|uniref:YaaC family protein n=1 Tax=Acinetobacter sp. MF4642 TaxID=1960825 RepID=UPI00099493B8|nr:YaaC family protein [Acinetobacter sp. MF4642]
MSKQIEKGEIALFKYNKLRFSFANLKAGDQQILTSDPWSLINSHLQQKISRSRGENKIFLERSLYFSSLAESFYKAANSILLPTRATLLYYGMLNLVKCFLSYKKIELETVHEHHGLTLPLGTNGLVQVKPNINNAVNIFSTFSELLGKKINQTLDIKFNNAVQNIPEIHSLCHGLGLIPKRKLLPVQIEILTNAEHNKLFTEVIIENEQKTKVDVAKFLKKNRLSYFNKGFPREGKITYRSKSRKPYTNANINTIYQNILKEYCKFEITPILTNTGYRYYVDLKATELPHLSYSLLCMFYLGTVARYRPSEANELLHGTLRPVVSEFVNISPNQFLYQLCSILLEKECVMPFSSITPMSTI